MKKRSGISVVIEMLFLPLAASLGALGAQLILDVPIDLIIVLTFGGIVLGIYGINGFTDLEDMVNRPEKRLFFSKRPIIFYSLIGILISCVVLLLLTHRFSPAHFIIIVLGFAYSYNIVPILDKNHNIVFKRLKEILFVKSLSVALIWGNAFFTINLALHPDLFLQRADIYLFIISFTIVTFVNTTFLDIRDVIGDTATGVSTIPVRFGVPKTILFAIALPSSIWLAIIIGVSMLGIVDRSTVIFLLINALFPVFYIGGYYSKIIPKRIIGVAADSCAFIFSIGLIVLSIARHAAI
jgi:4-hydroxybenzoate polyprenyltransferase